MPTRNERNKSVERMGASRLGQFQFVRQRRLAPTAHARCWALQESLHRLEEQYAYS